MKEYTLLIAAIDTHFTENLIRSIQKISTLRILGATDDGRQALHMVNTLHPDIILMDLFLPGLDGLCLLKEMQQMRSRPSAICMLDFLSPANIDMAGKNGASYLICKPATVNSIISILLGHISYLSSKEEQKQLDQQIDNESAISIDVHRILHALGFSFKLAGSKYLAESVIISAKAPTMIRNLSADLYSEIAHRRNTTPVCIERSIRTAIAAANTTGSLTRLLGTSPTNKRCIQYVLDRIISSEVSSEAL